MSECFGVVSYKIKTRTAEVVQIKIFQCPKWSTLRRRDTSRVKFTV
nr:MAG TPA: hypothetical protein [Caudoviricetes sp.]